MMAIDSLIGRTWGLGVVMGGCRDVLVLGWLVWGPVQIACLGVEREIFVPARRHNGSEKNLFSHCSSRNYPSMIHFVLTGVIGF